MKKTLFSTLMVIAALLCSCTNESIVEEPSQNKTGKTEIVIEYGDGSSRSLAGGTCTGAGIFDSDKKHKVTATPNADYDLDYFYGGPADEPEKYKNDSEYEFYLNGKDHKFKVNFKKKQKELKVVALTGGDVTGGGIYNVKEAITITATPKEGYSFAGWEVTSGDATIANSGSATTTVTLNSSNSTVTAKFAVAKVYYTILLCDEQLEGREMAFSGKVTMNGEELPYSYDAVNCIKEYFLYTNSPDDISIIPASGYAFNGWMDERSNQISQDGYTLSGYDIYLNLDEGATIYASLTNNNPTQVFYDVIINKISSNITLEYPNYPSSWPCDKAEAVEYKLSCSLGSGNCGTLYLYYYSSQADIYSLSVSQPYLPSKLARWDDYNKAYDWGSSLLYSFTSYKWVTPIGNVEGSIPGGDLLKIMGSLTSGNKTYTIIGK